MWRKMLFVIVEVKNVSDEYLIVNMLKHNCHCKTLVAVLDL